MSTLPIVTIKTRVYVGKDIPGADEFGYVYDWFEAEVLTVHFKTGNMRVKLTNGKYVNEGYLKKNKIIEVSNSEFMRQHFPRGIA